MIPSSYDYINTTQFPIFHGAVLSRRRPDTRYFARNSHARSIGSGSACLNVTRFLGSIKKPHQFLVAFALETNEEKKNALQKLQSKNADMIVLNSLKDEGAGFGFDTNKITIFDKSGKEYHFDTKSKQEVATDIVNTIILLNHV